MSNEHQHIAGANALEDVPTTLDLATAHARLLAAPWRALPSVQETFELFSSAGVEVRAVGGCVRDALLGLACADVDFCTPAHPEEVIALARAARIKCVPTGLDHGTVTLVFDAGAHEVTTLRRDVDTDGRHARVVFTDDWRADARRRDFTINAFYADGHGNLLDPLDGIGDLRAGKVRFIGSARERIREDYLRVLRYYRFFARFERGGIDAEAGAAIDAERDALAGLSGERVWAELRRLLSAPRVLDAVEDMAARGVLGATLGLTPAISYLREVLDLEATMTEEKDAPTAPIRRLAALFDLGSKPQATLDALAERLRLSKTEHRHLAACRRGASRAVSTPQLDGAVQTGGDPKQSVSEQVQRVAFARVHDLGPVAAADAAVLLAARSNDPAIILATEAARAALDGKSFPVTGDDLQDRGWSAGPALGDEIRRLTRLWVESGFQLDREQLLARVGDPKP
ncbi:MAG: CCA tRNA nucleotidyltransferase [Pseudomonadota bacterium]